MFEEKRDFFISLNSKDKTWGDWVVYHLKRKGYSVYYQFDDFPPGSDFMELMNQALANTSGTIAVWTDRYFESDFASLEGRIALKQSLTKDKIAYIPVKVENCEIDPLFSTQVYINLEGHQVYQAQKLLIGGVEAALNKLKKATSDIKKAPKFPGDKKGLFYKDDPIQREVFSIPRPLTVLYAGSKKSSSLDLETSYRTIESSLNRHIKKGAIKFNKNLNINTSNIFDILIKHQPAIFHFSGKQDGGDIRMTDENNNIVTISDVALAGYLTSLGDNIKLAIIDTCYSYDCAKSISDVVDFAIGVKSFIYDQHADSFFKVLYNALCEGFSLKNSVGQATASLKFLNVPKNQIPVLFSKESANPAKALFVKKNVM